MAEVPVEQGCRSHEEHWSTGRRQIPVQRQSHSSTAGSDGRPPDRGSSPFRGCWGGSCRREAEAADGWETRLLLLHASACEHAGRHRGSRHAVAGAAGKEEEAGVQEAGVLAKMGGEGRRERHDPCEEACAAAAGSSLQRQETSGRNQDGHPVRSWGQH